MGAQVSTCSQLRYPCEAALSAHRPEQSRPKAAADLQVASSPHEPLAFGSRVAVVLEGAFDLAIHRDQFSELTALVGSHPREPIERVEREPHRRGLCVAARSRSKS